MKKIMRQILDKKNIIPAIVLLIIITLVTVFLYLNDDNQKAKEVKYEEYTIHEGITGKVEKYDPSMTVEGYKGGDKAYYVTGKISAKQDKDYSIITFNLYDKDDNLLGTAVAGINELEKNKIYDFKALSLIESENVEKVTRYELESVKLG